MHGEETHRFDSDEEGKYIHRKSSASVADVA